jgi:hypothetical protein
VRDPLDWLRLAFVAGLVVTVVAGSAEAIANMAVATVVVLLARPARLPVPYDLAVIVAMAFTGFGEALGLYDSVSWYDNVVHFVVPMLSSQVLYLCLARLEFVPHPRSEVVRRDELGMFVVCFALGAAVGAVWEIWEFFSDGVLGSDLQLGNEDTVGDLIADTLGSLAGAGLLVAWSELGPGTIERAPG